MSRSAARASPNGTSSPTGKPLHISTFVPGRGHAPRTWLDRTPPPVGRIARMSVAAAVIDVGWVNGLAAIRSLGRAGIRVLALDHRPSALGFRSKYAERFLCPDPRSDETRFVAFVRALGEVVVFPTHDDSLTTLAQYPDALP